MGWVGHIVRAIKYNTESFVNDSYKGAVFRGQAAGVARVWRAEYPNCALVPDNPSDFKVLALRFRIFPRNPFGILENKRAE